MSGVPSLHHMASFLSASLVSGASNTLVGVQMLYGAGSGVKAVEAIIMAVPMSGVTTPI